MEKCITGKGDEVGPRISNVVSGHICKCNLYEALHGLIVCFHVKKKVIFYHLQSQVS